MIHRKRKREALSVDAELVEIYESLASEEESTRLRAASLLLSKVSPANGADAVARHKALQRLLKGLSSGRKGARVGFSVVLVEFLRSFGGEADGGSEPSFGIGSAIDELETTTHVSADGSRQEIRDHYLGKVFGAAAFIRSGVLFTSDQDTTNWKRLLKFVVATAKEKSWLREECGWALYESLTQLKETPGASSYVAALVDELEEASMFKTPEGIAIWIGVKCHFPAVDMPKTIYSSGDPLHKKEKASLARILKESSARNAQEGEEPDSQTSQSSGYWNPKIHFSWTVVFDELSKRNPISKPVSFADLWKEAVDDGLFSMKASHQRRYWGFHLFQYFVRHGPADDLAALIGPNLLRCLTNQTATDDRLLNVAATQSIEAMIERAKKNPASVRPMVLAIVTHNINFDHAAKTKVTEKLLAEADLNDGESLISDFGRLLQQKNAGGSTNQQEVLSLADYIVCLVRTQEYPKDPERQQIFRVVVDKALELLVMTAFKTEHISSSTANGVKTRIMSCLNHVITKDVEDLAHHPYHVLSAIQATGFQPDAEDAVAKAVAKAHRTLTGILNTPSSAEQQEILQAFKLLFTFALLQTYYGEADAVNVLDDLQECYKSLQKKSKTDNVEESVTTLVEVIVEFVSRQSSLYRRLAPKILATVANRITEQGLDVLLHVLESKEDVQGQGELFSAAGEDEMDLDAADDTGLGSDVDDVSETEDSDVTSSSGDSEDSDGTELSEGEDAQEEDDAELAAFDAKLAEALGTRRGDQDIAMTDSESSDEDMDDKEMEGLDAHLSNIFKQRLGQSTKGKEKKRARDTIINFKTKVLELLEVYVKREYRNPKTLYIVGPLLLAMEATTSNLISQKSAEVIRHLTKLYKVKADTNEEPGIVATAEELLSNVHTVMLRTRSQLQAKACSSASLLAVKTILSHGGDIAVPNQKYQETIGELNADGQFKFRQCFAEDWRNWQAQASRSGIIPESKKQ